MRVKCNKVTVKLHSKTNLDTHRVKKLIAFDTKFIGKRKMNREYDQLKQIVVRKTEICNKRNIKKRKKSNSEILLRMRSKK
jgi:hypothetical protein